MRVLVSAAAGCDLSGIWIYSIKRWDEAQSDRYVRQFLDSFDGLARGTLKGRNADDIRTGYFKLAVGSHLVVYRMGAAGVIDIGRILHQHLDVNRHP